MRTTPADIAGLAKFILSDECRKIGFLSGAGVSVASGIPDFRSPGGMYDRLRPELLTASKQEQELMKMDPAYVVSWDIFQSNPFPYLEVRRPFILGTQSQTWKATIFHRFAELLEQKTDKLQRLYTQNIDGLDFQTSIPVDKIVPVHGSLAKVNCEGCGTEYDFDEFCSKVSSSIKDIYNSDNSDAPKTSTPILCDSCGKALVKPKTVLFGRSLPEQFFECVQTDKSKLDLLIVAGTSLQVSPANSLVNVVGPDTIRVVVNRDPVGAHFGVLTESRDLFLQGDCDDVFLALISELGWLEELNASSLPKESANKLEKLRQDTA